MSLLQVYMTQGQGSFLAFEADSEKDGSWGIQIDHAWITPCQHEMVNLIGGPACRKCGWTP